VSIQSGSYVIANIGSMSISGNAVFVSGTVALLSGGFVNVGSGIGVIIDNKLQSGQYIIMSGQGVSIASGIAYQMSGANVIATVSVGSGLYIVMSGQGVSIASGIAYQMSGANVIATVSVGSGLYTVAGGINRAINSGGQTILASGVIAIPSLDVNGNLVVMTSGQTANMISGQALFVQMSGVNTMLSGIYVIITSGIGVIQKQAAFGSIFTNLISIVTAASGGMVLQSAQTSVVTLKSLSANSGLILVGATAAGYYPFYVGATSGQGFVLDAGDAITLPVLNPNLISVVASYSGDKVSWIGVN
jgi:hypothetical protein